MILICPHCQAVSNHQTPVGHNADEPANGDKSICAGCAEVSIIDDTRPTNLRIPDDDEQRAITASPEIKEARAAITSRNL